VELGDLQRREFHEALLEAASFEDLSCKWQAAILKAEQNRPKLRVATSNYCCKPCHSRATRLEQVRRVAGDDPAAA
jgi:hypothetical protein